MLRNKGWFAFGIVLTTASCGDDDTAQVLGTGGAAGAGGSAATGGRGGSGGTGGSTGTGRRGGTGGAGGEGGASGGAGAGGSSAECVAPTTSAAMYCCHWRTVDCGRMQGGVYVDACLSEEEAKDAACPVEYGALVTCAVEQGWACDGSTGYPYYSGCEAESNALLICLRP